MKDEDGDEVIFVQPHVQPIFVPGSDDEMSDPEDMWFGFKFMIITER